MASAEYYRAKFPEMSDEQIARLVDIDRQVEPKLCRIDEPDCESCQ
jgi:hypothetical protein